MRLQFDYDGCGSARGGIATLIVNGEKVGEGRIAVAQPGVFSADISADAGINLGTPAPEAIGAEATPRFTGAKPKTYC